MKSNFSAPTHWPEWNRIVSKHYGTDFFYLGAYEKDQLIGLCPVHKVKRGAIHVLHSGQHHYIPYGGWIFSRKTPVDDSFFKVGCNEALTGFALPSIDGYALEWRMKQPPSRFATLCIDLSRSEEWIWTNMLDAKRRNMIRKATKNRIEVEKIDRGNFNLFYDIYKQANERNGLASLYTDCLSELLFDTGNVFFMGMVAKQGGRPLNAVVVVLDKDYALYWLGAGAADAPNMGQGELLQWEAIRCAKDHGCRLYDLCYIEKERLPSIYEFKKGFAKSEHAIMHFQKKSLGYRLLNRLTK